MIEIRHSEEKGRIIVCGNDINSEKRDIVIDVADITLKTSLKTSFAFVNWSRDNRGQWCYTESSPLEAETVLKYVGTDMKEAMEKVARMVTTVQLCLKDHLQIICRCDLDEDFHRNGGRICSRFCEKDVLSILRAGGLDIIEDIARKALAKHSPDIEFWDGCKIVRKALPLRWQCGSDVVMAATNAVLTNAHRAAL